MAGGTSHSGTRVSGGAVWGTVGVAALAVLVLALSFFALTENRNVAEAGSTPGATEAAASASPSPSPSASPVVAQPIAAPTRVLTALDGQRAVRAAVTACPGATTVELTEDGGASWVPVDAETVAAVQRLEIGDQAFLGAIGADASGCAPAYERSFTDGVAWETAPDELSVSWYVEPSGPAAVHTPAGAGAAAPCPVVQLAPADSDSAAALCADSSVVATEDAGATWSTGIAVAGARAISASDGGYVVAISGGEGCDGVQAVDLVVEGAGLAAGTAGACLGASAGAVAISAAGAEVWVWVDDAVGRSADLGETWS